MNYYKQIRPMIFAALTLLLIVGCSKDDDGMTTPDDNGGTPVTGKSQTYDLGAQADASISGSAKFIENSDNSVTIELELQNTPAGGMHPAHIHFNTAAEGGDIALTLGTVNGDTGKSSITVSALDDNTAITYDQLLAFDGYINVHLSADELGTLVAQGDIGQNDLTGESKSYDLDEKAVAGIEGTATFYERVNGEALAVLDIENTPADGTHPAHIHMNTAAESGAIAYTFVSVDGSTGISNSNVATLDDGTAFGYNQILEYDGYINVHLSADALGTIVAQGDIGQNELTGESKAYVLGEKDVDGIDGTATFYERVNGEALAVLEINNTPADGMHPAHIHNNTAVEGGAIAFTFTEVDGSTGISTTNVASLDNETAIGYDELLDFNGYINVHLSANALSTIVAQGDIGQNELTGKTKTYDLETKDVAGISGTATFAERVNSTTLVTLALVGTSAGNEHPAHIHANDIATTGEIIVGLSAVQGASGISQTQVANLVSGASVTYDEFLDINAYINVHLSDSDLATIVAQGNIGANADASTSNKNYDVTNEGATAYVFNGEGLSNVNNPALTLKRGATYTFTINSPGHPFYIKDVKGTGKANAYSTGVTGNGATNGTVTFTVPNDAPDTLYYNCEFHALMTGVLTITD